MTQRSNLLLSSTLLLLPCWLAPAWSQQAGDPAAGKPPADAQPVKKDDGRRLGQMISIRGTIDSGLKNRIISASRAAVADGAEVIIYDIQATNSDFGPCYDLAQAIVELGGNLRRTVAFVNKQLTGHAVLVALACDEIVLSDNAKIGDVYRDSAGAGGAFVQESAYRQISRDKQHSVWLTLGMVNKNLRVLEVTTPNGKQFLPADELEAFSKTARVIKSEPIKEAGSLLLLDAATAKRYGLIRLIANSPREVATAYGLPEEVAADDLLLDESIKPLLIRLEGSIDQRMYQYLLRRIKQAEASGVNMVFVQIDSTHGVEAAASNIAGALRAWQVKKVAWVDRQATGPSTLILFGCDELVMAPKATVGGFRPDKTSPEEFKALADIAVSFSQGSKYPEAVVRGMIDPNTVVFDVRNKQKPGLRSFLTAQELENPDIAKEWEKARPGPVKDGGIVWEMNGSEAQSNDMAVATATTQEELTSLYDIQEPLAVLQPGWVDALVDVLTSTGGTVFLLALGLTCLYIEFHIPGFGVAGLLSAICFVLFFWSRYLSDTANSLEIVMFLLGILLLAVELFVLPGFGVTGVAGVLLMLVSLVLASQSFTVPHSHAERQELLRNVVTIGASLVVLVCAGVGLARYFPMIPVFNRMVLSPPEAGGDALDDEYAYSSVFDDTAPYKELLGRKGVAASTLRPAGRMQMGDQYLDVIAQGAFIDEGTPIEVIEVSHHRIVVRETTIG